MTDEQIEHLDNAMMFSQFSSKMGAAVEITPQHMNDIRQLIEQRRTLKQQNAQMEKEHKVMKRALKIVVDTLVSKVHDDRTSHGLHQEASAALQSLQGGESNANES